ncbi:MAG: sensor histidine kinase [Candidatus Omnitrophota bacterium]|nr:sensor histidine kinase [Candidatus Omnitrophota bacterium]
MKLGTKLMASYTGIVLIAVAIVLVIVIDNSIKTYKERIGSDLQHVAEFIARDIDSYLRGIIADTKKYSHTREIESGDMGSIRPFLPRLLEDIPLYSSISVVDPDGGVAASTDPVLAGKNFLDKEQISLGLFNNAKKDRRGYVIFRDVSAGERGRRLKALILTPVMDKDNRKAVFILAGTVRMDRLVETTYRIDPYTAGDKAIYPVREPGDVILTRDGEVTIFTPVTYLQINNRLPALKEGEKTGHVIYKDRRGDVVLAGYADLDRYREGQLKDWSVVSLVFQKDIFGPAVKLRNRIIVVGIIAVAIAWVIAFFVARGITRPILELVAVTGEIAKGDLSKRADIRTNDEVGELERSFNKMTDKLGGALHSREMEITERKKIAERLKDEIDAKAKFISMVSCEFRTPLTTIKEGINMVLDEIKGKIDQRQKKILGLAGKSVNRLTRLIDDIVRFHHLETGRIEFSMLENDINEVVREVRKAMAPMLTGKEGLELIVKTDDSLPVIRFDREKITQVLASIVNSAVSVTEKGNITISTSMEGDDSIRVSVEDTGAGIKKEDLPRLFLRYEHPGKRRDKKGGGSGLGLAISREMIEKHGGGIWAESEDGKGTTFYFVLPIKGLKEK